MDGGTESLVEKVFCELGRKWLSAIEELAVSDGATISNASEYRREIAADGESETLWMGDRKVGTIRREIVSDENGTRLVIVTEKA